MKVVASDLGRYEQEAWVDHVTIAPAERYVVDVRFDEPGEVVARQSRARDRSHPGALLRGAAYPRRGRVVAPTRATPDHAAAFDRLRRNADVAADVARYRPQFQRPVDHELTITLETGDLPFPLGR